MNAQAEQKIPHRMWMWLQPRITALGLTLLLATASILFFWWSAAKQGPAEVGYCLKHQDGSLHSICLERTKLNIPGTYRPRISRETHPRGGPAYVELEVAYPSMQPWHTVPLWERRSAHKIAIDMRGIAEPQPYADNIEIFASPPSLFIHMSEPLYGLDNWVPLGQRRRQRRHQ